MHKFTERASQPSPVPVLIALAATSAGQHVHAIGLRTGKASGGEATFPRPANALIRPISAAAGHTAPAAKRGQAESDMTSNRRATADECGIQFIGTNAVALSAGRPHAKSARQTPPLWSVRQATATRMEHARAVIQPHAIRQLPMIRAAMEARTHPDRPWWPSRIVHQHRVGSTPRRPSLGGPCMEAIAWRPTRATRPRRATRPTTRAVLSPVPK